MEPLVRVVQGSLRGRQVRTKTGVTYYSFQGIPYAKPPVGSLRFKAPEAVEPWNGVRDALTEGSVAPHMDDFLTTEYLGEEDCLFLNVYTPTLPGKETGAKRAVMMWIHGGGFYLGSGNSDFHGPDYLVAEDVVLVTINYRLGALGFLSTGDSVIPGNNGLKDQVMALRWVQQNIAEFGGDPNNVTIFGGSAGAACVHHHMFSPMSRGLFHKAIAQSGSAFNPWAFEESALARSKAFRFGEAVGCKTNDSKILYEYLMKLPAKILVEGMDKSLTCEEKHPLPLFFTPTNETIKTDGEQFITDTPTNLLKEGKLLHIPFMMGVTTHEGMFVLKDVVQSPDWFESLNKEFKLPVPHGLNIQDGTILYKEIAAKVKQFYFGSKSFSKEVWREFADLYSDVWFLWPHTKAAKHHVNYSSSPLYLFTFAFDGILGFAEEWVGKEGRFPGVCHGDEIGYLFQTITNNDKMLDPEDDNMKTLGRMTKLWTNFAKTGNPNAIDDSRLGVTWKPATKTELQYLNIDRTLSMQANMEEKRIRFWEKIFHDIMESD